LQYFRSHTSKWTVYIGILFHSLTVVLQWTNTSGCVAIKWTVVLGGMSVPLSILIFKRNRMTTIKSNFGSPYRVISWLFRQVENTECTFSKTVISRCPSSTKMHKNRSGISTGAICNISTSFLLVGTTVLISSEPNCLIYQQCVVLYNSPVTWPPVRS